MSISNRCTFLKIGLVFTFTCFSYFVSAQLFQETFDEANGSTTGTENIAGIPWTTTCTTCSGSWDVNGNELVANNTDGEAVWKTTTALDISSCSYIEITIDIEADGDFEGQGTVNLINKK